MALGIVSPNYVPNKNPLSQFGSPESFTAGAEQQASDYDSIMQQYKDLVASFKRNPVTAQPVAAPTITPTTTNYTESSDVADAISKMGQLAATGGYSDQDIANIRARDISPIRSIYANDQMQLENQRRLQGGYSPGFQATIDQLSRDEAQQISDVTTSANAGIAQNVAANKIQAGSQYSNAASAEAQRKTAVDEANANIVNQVKEANAQLGTQVGEFNAGTNLEAQKTNQSNIFGAIGGQTSLYGTTPAVTATFGNQVVAANQLGQGQQALNQRNLQLAGNIASSGGW